MSLILLIFKWVGIWFLVSMFFVVCCMIIYLFVGAEKLNDL
jgi:hypothetical protein